MRVSRKMVIEYAEEFGYRLVVHQQLGNARNYWYKYSLVRESNNEVICDKKTLRECFTELVRRIRDIAEV